MNTSTPTNICTATKSPPVFDGQPIKCRVNFTRGQNPSGPTIVSQKTNLAKGDLFVISLNDEGTQKIVMEVDRVEDDRPVQLAIPEISMDESIRKAFCITSFMTNCYTFQKIHHKEKFALYLVEVQIKEQYLSRGDMWRFARKLYNTSAYLKKTVDIFGMRATIYGLWVTEHPYRVSSGYITEHTKVVFRSLSACCTIFLQMSKEMWEFDHQGDTYYEKAVDGFLFDLFTRWKHMLCQHDVTMTLFSRVIYNAKSLDEFPESLRQDICVDHKGRFYEDFYRVIYQNERYDDWLPRLAKIKQVLISYKEDIQTYHKKRLPKAVAKKMPNGTVSSAADGNYLETLNLSSSVFERHFIDRSFDRLGLMSIIITPGSGIFEVDRELANMTKQRVLDNGIGTDLVCLGEQPLFAVPLFKYFKENPNTAENYQIPHWINLSYYRYSTVQSCFKHFIPRVPFDTNRVKHGMLEVKDVMHSMSETSFSKPPHLTMEEYDYYIFRTITKNSNFGSKASDRLGGREHPVSRRRHITTGSAQPSTIVEEETLEEPKGMLIVDHGRPAITGFSHDPHTFNMNIKDDLAISSSHHVQNSTVGQYLYCSTFNATSQNLMISSHSSTRVAQSAETFFLSSSLFPQNSGRPKALTNPFAPASISMPLEPGRRKWAHTFPMGPNKIPWHFHHLRQLGSTIKEELVVNIHTHGDIVIPGTSKRIMIAAIPKRINQHSKTNSDMSIRPKRILSPSNADTRRLLNDRQDNMKTSNDNRSNSTNTNTRKSYGDFLSRPPPALKREKKETIIWGPTGVEPWSASMRTGIDWKSLTIPAALPTTFDGTPMDEELKQTYTHNSYELLAFLPPLSDYEKKRRSIHNGSTNNEKGIMFDLLERQKTVYDELVDQRLSQGFQIIPEIPPPIQKMVSDSIRRTSVYKETQYHRLLSIGKIYHILSLLKEENPTQDTVIIHVLQFKPQHIFQPKTFRYKYRFQCPDSSYYDPANIELQLESLESFPWNSVDNIIFSRGTVEHTLTDPMKYWRIRLVLMPVSRDYTVKSIESGQKKCDSCKEMSHEDFFLFVEHFVRFLLMLNKLTRIRTGANEFNHRPLDPVTGLKRIDYHKRQGKHAIPCKTFKLDEVIPENVNSIKYLTQLMCDEQQGLSFVKDSILPEYSFIAIEAIWWAIEHCDDIKDENMAYQLFQSLFQNQYIKHCTNTEKSFRFGFFLYYIVTDKTVKFNLQSNDYAEVEFYQTKSYIPSMDYIAFHQCHPMRLLPKFVMNFQTIIRQNRPQTSNSTTKNENSFSSYDTAQYYSKSTSELSATEVKRHCNVDVDPKHISDRREWAMAQYHSCYNPHCLFELDIYWLVATSCILGDLITNWSQRTGTMLGSNQVSFHLVPIPSDPFAEFDALRGPIYIKMDTSSVHSQLASLTLGQKLKKLNAFQELVLKRYGFVLNSCCVNKCEDIFYVHISGGMLVYIISDEYNGHRSRQQLRIASSESVDNETSPLDCGFYWCWNFCLGKKWRSSQTGEEKYQDIMLEDFRAFCTNDKDRLLNFWNEVSEIGKAKMP